MENLEFVFDTQMLIEGADVKIEKIKSDIEKMKGDCLLVVGDDGFARIHFHTNKPWEVLQYCASCGTISDIVVENMEKQQEEFEN